MALAALYGVRRGDNPDKIKRAEFKRSRLQFGCARITSAICGSVNLILVVGFIGYAQLPRSFSGTSLIQSVSRSLVALPPARDLFLRAKYLFFAAMMAAVPTWGAAQHTAFR